MTKARMAAKEAIRKLLQERKDTLVYRINDKRRELLACHNALALMKRERAELQIIINKICSELRIEVKP